MAFRRHNHAKESEEGVPLDRETNVEHTQTKFPNILKRGFFYYGLTPLYRVRLTPQISS